MVKNDVLDSELQEEISIYARISVDLDEDSDDNTSIENQLKIIKNEIRRKFPKCTFKEYIDRDRSGYTFEQREGYQEMRKALLSGQSRILMIKDFSRFARRAGAGLVELEFLRDTGIRIISVMEAIDYPKQDDWLGIQVRFLMNEQPVTGTSKSVKRSIATMQQEGEWLCSVPYGYIVTTVKNKQKVEIVLDEAVVIKEIFRLYAYEGWGYKKIASYLTDKNIPTPRMKSNQRLEEAGRDVKQKSSRFWSVVTISSLLANDFYIGTYRGHKYTRTKINGSDVKVDESEHIVIERHHEAIINDKMFLYTQEQLKLRTASATHYRGQKKYDTPYTGYLFCGDCGSPMFSRSRPDLEPSYICGNYHKNGLKACTSHHTRFDLLDSILKDYVQLVKNNCQDMISELEKTIATEADNVKENDRVIKLLEGQLASAKEELKACKKQKIRELAKADDPELIEETYTEIEQEITDRIHGLQEQLKSSIDKRSQVVEIARMAKTVFDVFDDILSKKRLDKVDISLVVDKIAVFESGLIEVNLKPDIMALLETGTLPNEVEVDPVNFNFGSIDSLFNALYTYKIPKRREQVYTANVVREGDPLEIFTDREGEIILKKYSPIGELGAFAKEYAESLAQTAGHITCIVDKDQIIAVSGGGKKEFFEKHISPEMENCINRRTALIAERNDSNFVPVLADDDGTNYNHQLIMPIIAEGDAMGAIVFLSKDQKMGEVEGKLAQTAAGFLGKQMEQ